MGNILDMARADLKQFLSTGGFEVDITLESPSPSPVIVVVKGYANRINVDIDSDGQVMSSMRAHADIFESAITDADPTYPIRDSSNKVNMKGHKLTYTDTTGVSETYQITESHPDEQLGHITFMLGEYE